MKSLFSALAWLFETLAGMASRGATEFVSKEDGIGKVEGRLLPGSRRIVTRQVKEDLVFGGATYLPGVYEVEQEYDDELSYVNAPFGIGGGYYKSGWRATGILKRIGIVVLFSAAALSASAGEKFFISNVFSGDKFELSCYGVKTVCLADGTVADSPFIGYIPVRLAGVDSPEACPGEEARAEAREFGVSMRELFVYGCLEMLGAQIGKRLKPEVDVVFDSLTPDEFGFYHVYLPLPRRLAKRYKSRNEWLVATGHARVPRDEEFFFKEEFLALEKQAREQKRYYWDGLFDLPRDAEGNRIIRGVPHGIQ